MRRSAAWLAPLRGGSRGQASIELVAVVPLVALTAIALLHVLAARGTADLATHAAEAGARALQAGEDPRAAAAAALPGWPRERIRVDVRHRTVRVRLRPRALTSAIGDLLAATATADAGPKPDPRIAGGGWDGARGGDGAAAGRSPGASR